MKVYYQPELTDKFLNKNPDFYSFYIFRSKKLAELVFPEAEIKTYTGDDIENPTYVDYMYDNPLYHIKIQPLQVAVNKKLKIKTNFKSEVKRWGTNKTQIRLEIQSDNLIDKSGIFGLPLEEVVIGNFGGGSVNKTEEGKQYVWFNLHIYYQHKEGGRNGLHIGYAWYFIDTKEWKFEFVDEKKIN